MTSDGQAELAERAVRSDPMSVVDRSGGRSARRALMSHSDHVSTLRRFGHYCRPVSAGAANHVTLGKLRARVPRLVQWPGGDTRQQGAG